VQLQTECVLIFKWFIPVVCDYNIKYENDIRWVIQNTTLYYGVRCQTVDMFRPFSIRPSSGLTWWTKEHGSSPSLDTSTVSISTGTHNPDNEPEHSTITQRTLKKTSDPIYIEDIGSTQISPGLNGIEPPQWDRRLHHGHTAFCTCPTTEI